ncbi:ankyrin [Decorospora gaudefroyi]|uniref:Ankyrin n=1 Tax=Decorospora gaudefroyi TaxID=184978 RepID=A0A6A5KVN2_9PLEO|nr:ankyrin [Decorospora gaudefroyi]
MATPSDRSEDDAVVVERDEDTVIIDREDVSNYNPEQILPESPEDVLKIRKWLRPTHYADESGEFRKHLASYMIGTGAWLTSDDTYRKWLDSQHHGMLWIKGIPGSGKSVVAAHLIDLLGRSNPGAPVLYFFFRQIIHANHEPVALLRDWLDQILEYSPPLQKRLKDLVEEPRSLGSLSMDDLWKYLRFAFSGLPGNVYCVVDALDEMDGGNDEFLQALAALGQWKPDQVKVLMTSRPVSNVEEPLRQANMLRLRLEEHEVDVDIATYVQHGLKESSIPASDQDLVRGAIPGRANGIFLYAKLAMNAFLEPGASPEEVMRTLPADLHEMYTSLLHEHGARSGVPKDIQLLILQWVTHANRPLRLIELAEMINVTYHAVDGNNTERDLKSSKNLVRAAAGPLLEILPDETVCVIHHSFTEYLKCMKRFETDESYPVLRPGSTHGRLALACLSYLQAGCLDCSKIASADDDGGEDNAEALYDRLHHFRYYGRDKQVEKEEQRIRLQYPFAAYATENWHLHVARSQSTDFSQAEINTAIDHFFQNEHRMRTWLRFQWIEPRDAKNIAPLAIAARYGLVSYVRHLISKQVDVEGRDVYGTTALWWAAASGHAEIIRLLVQAGANPDIDDKMEGLKPLHEAAKNNHSEAIGALLEAGVDALSQKTLENPGRSCGNGPTSIGHTPLMYACHNGHLEALNAFLPFLTDINTVHQALAWSARCGRSKLVKRILQHTNVDVNVKVRGVTALYQACTRLDRDSIVTLLEAGADPRILCDAWDDEFGGIGSGGFYFPEKVKDETRGFTALYALCCAGQPGYPSAEEPDPEALRESFSLLVEKGADVHQRTDDGSTCLHAAVNSPIFTRLLLDAGADANAVDNIGRVPLHAVASPECVDLLVEASAEIDKTISSDGRSPLLRSLEGYNNEVTLKLLEHGPNLCIKDKRGNGPLHVVLAQWTPSTTVIKSLLAAGADPNERNRAGETPLLVLRLDRSESVAIMDMLLAAGADINATDTLGMTVLSRNVGNHFPPIESDHSDLKALLDRGADLNIRDHKGRTLLHHAVAQHDTIGLHIRSRDKTVTRLDFLLSLGLDVLALDYRGNSLIHELAVRRMDFYTGPRYIPLWEQLLALGIDIDQANQQGRTALHMLAASQPTGYSPVHGPLDLVISKIKNIDQCDLQGLTALHLASTVSEYTTKKLFDAGADPTSQTLEGLTPLSLAARARESNIVGLLLSFEKPGGKNAVNYPDEKGRTPMYYACRSGRPETVRLLLDGGAEVSLTEAFFTFTIFEEEERLWGQKRHVADMEAHQCASGLMIDDTTRPVSLGNNARRSFNEHHTTRLEEIIDMLCGRKTGISDSTPIVSGPWTSPPVPDTLHDYTWACLLRAYDCLSEGQKSGSTNLNSFEEHTVKASRDAYTFAMANFMDTNNGVVHRDVIECLLKKRQYHTMRVLFEKGANFLQEGDRPILELFVQYGYASLLDEIGTFEVERQLKEGKWHAFGDKTKPGLHSDMELQAAEVNDYDHTTFLLTALQRELPNMDVVRLLLEKFYVDVDQFRYQTVWLDNSKYELEPHETALHFLAKGTHWWHTALAMPYLISKGAKINIKNHAGCTPLHIALGGLDERVGPFHKDAARVLVAAGADLDVQDGQGRSCLANAANDIEMTQLLIDHGVSIQADALFMAIKERKVEVLEALLSAGADPNMRCEAAEIPPDLSKRRNWKPTFPSAERGIPSHEMYPLYAAARMHGVRGGSDHRPAEEKRPHAAIQMMEALLKHGANPHAFFKRRNPDYTGDLDEDTEDDTIRALFLKKKNPDVEFKKVSILHELLSEDELVHPILSLGTLNPNRQDGQGQTVLHAACHSSCGINAPIDSLFESPSSDSKSQLPSFLDCLLARGADPLATDDEGRNILHHIFEKSVHHDSSRNYSAITQIAKDYPTLINKSDTYGITPLHLALQHAVQTCDTAPAKALLSLGADPFATENNGNGALHILSFLIYECSSIRTLFTTLVSRGLDTNQRNNRAETPIFNLNKHTPAHTRHLHHPPEPPIPAAEALSLFVDAGADLFERNADGQGLLHIAAKGIEERTRNEDCFVASFFQNCQIDGGTLERGVVRFEVLVQKGLDPWMEDGCKRTALDVAAACGKESILALFENKDGRRLGQDG